MLATAACARTSTVSFAGFLSLLVSFAIEWFRAFFVSVAASLAEAEAEALRVRDREHRRLLVARRDRDGALAKMLVRWNGDCVDPSPPKVPVRPIVHEEIGVGDLVWLRMVKDGTIRDGVVQRRGKGWLRLRKGSTVSVFIDEQFELFARTKMPKG